MEKYDEYKDSGVEWIGEIPNNWNTIALKRTTNNDDKTFIDGDWIESKVITDNGIRYLTTGNIGPCVFKEQGNGFITEKTFKELNCTEVYPGDLLISRLNEPIGRCCIVPDLGNRIVTAVDNVIYRPHKEYNLRYMMYQMNCTPYTENANMIARGSTMHRISRGMLGSFKVCIPPHFEQQAIANYLDIQCTKIDKVIAAQEKRVKLLEELKQTIITRAVTRGVDPDVKLKDSGVEWIGNIPTDWKVIRMRYLCDMVTGDKDTIMREENGEYPFYVRSPKVERINTYSFDGEAVLMAGDGVGAGKVIHYATGKFDFHQRVYNFHHFKNITGKYLYYYLMSNFKYKIEEGGAKNTVDSVRLPWLKDFQICVPTIKEQNLIISHIEKQSSRINSAVSRVVHQIDLLKEYKQSLITEVVTGKRKVI